LNIPILSPSGYRCPACNRRFPQIKMFEFHLEKMSPECRMAILEQLDDKIAYEIKTRNMMKLR